MGLSEAEIIQLLKNTGYMGDESKKTEEAKETVEIAVEDTLKKLQKIKKSWQSTGGRLFKFQKGGERGIKKSFFRKEFKKNSIFSKSSRKLPKRESALR